MALTAAAWGAAFPTKPLGSQAGLQSLAVLADGPGWLTLPPLQVRVTGLDPGRPTHVLVARDEDSPWQEISLAEGVGKLPFSVPNSAALWSLRIRVDSDEPATVTVEPQERLSLARDPAQNNPDLPGFILSNWVEGSRVGVVATDASGISVPLACLDSANPCREESGAYDLGAQPFAAQTGLLALMLPDVRYPVVLTAWNSEGDHASVLVASPRAESGAYDQVVYYGMAKTEHDCSSNTLTNYTRMVITGIKDSTTYTVTDLNTSTVLTTGTVNRGATVTLQQPTYPLIDEHRYKLTASKPVQAYMGYDCSGTLPGTMFFLADDGVSMYGTAFTVPFANWETSGTVRLQYWVFSTGAGTVTVNPIGGGAAVATLTFTGAGAQQISLTGVSRNTTYAVTTTGAAFAIEQSSQNAATEVPPVGQTVVAGNCSAGYKGSEFYFHTQPWNSVAPQIAVFPYVGGTYSVDYWNGSAWVSLISAQTITQGTLDYRALTGTTTAYAYHVTTGGGAQIGILAGSLEPGPTPNGVWDLGDDAIYYRGSGNDVRGLAMRCGGTVFVAQDSTQLTVACSPGASCGIGTGTQTLNADGYLTISGDTADTNLFRLTTQDAQHPVLAEAFGGNCSTQLNDWGKIMLPMALLHPVITFPDTTGYMGTTSPLVTGTAIPGALVTLRIYDHTTGDTLIFDNSASPVTADASTGAWSVTLPSPLTVGDLYYFEPVQSLPGICPVNPTPPPGSSGSQGIVNTNPPIVLTPADGSTTTNTKPPISGTAPAYATVTVYIDGAAVGTTTADSSGNWTYTPSTALSLGSHTVKATAKDAANNTSAFSNTNTFTVAAAGTTITKVSSVTPGYASPGQTLTYTITVTNSTASTWTNVAVTDPLPANTTYVASSSQVTYTSLQTGTYLDQFPAIAYNGSNGTLPWASTPWTEINDDGSPTSGFVIVENRYSTNSLRINSRGGSLVGASRPANLTGVSASLSFVYRRRDSTSGQSWYVDISKDGGSTWPTRLWSLASGASDGSWISVGPLTIPSDYLTSTFVLRIVATGTAGSDTRCYFDNIQLSLTYPVNTPSAGGAPPNLASGYTLYPGESLTVTFQATVDPNLSNAVTAISNTATVTATGLSGSPSATVSDPVLPAPVVTSPINAGATSIGGTSSAPVGSTITIYKNGVSIGTTTVQSGGTWTLAGVSGLVGGESITAKASAGGVTSPLSGAVVVTPAPPVVTSPLVAGATSVSGTSTAPVGSTITVYKNGVSIGTTTVQAGGTWTLGGISPALAGGDLIKATVTAGGQASGDSNVVTVLALSTPPIVTASLLAGTGQTVFGSSIEAAGSTITVYVNGAAVGTTTVGADGSWSLTGVNLAAGDLVKATVLASGKAVSGYGNVVTVAAGSGSVTPPPIITAPVAAGATSVSGTFPTATAGVTIDLYADGVYLGSTTTDASGNWALGGLPALANGAILTATATQSGSGTSDWSAPVIVGTMVMMLRSDAMTSLTQARAPLFTHAVAAPPYPSLETLGPNHVFNSGEGTTGGQPSAAGTSDDDKAYLYNVTTGSVDPDPTVLTDNGRPLVFYELLDNNTKTLKLSKSGGQIVFTIQ